MEPWKLEPARDLNLPLLEQLRSPQRETGFLFTGMRLGWWSIMRSYLAMWHRLTIHGSANLPRKTPFILAANHCSHLDAIVLAAAMPWWSSDRVFPLAAGDVFFESPWKVAFAASLLNALPVWRRKPGNRSFATLRQRLVDQSSGYILFPEGARSRDGNMLPFKAGIGMLVAQTDVPVIPCYLSGCFEALPAGYKLPRRRRIHLHVGEPIRFAHLTNEKQGWQTVARTVEEAVVSCRLS